jgi:hypothetical protein
MENLVLLEESIKSFSDEEVRNLGIKLSQKIGNDVQEAVSFLENKPELASLFVSSSPEEYFSIIDNVEIIVLNELKGRSKKTSKH